MKKFFITLAAITLICALAISIAYRTDIYVWQQPQQTMWLTNGQLFTGSSERVIDNPGILIKSGKIHCIGNDCDIPANAIHLDATNKAIVPGLIDLHGHFFGGKQRDKSQSIPAMIWQQLRYLPDVRQSLINAGITSYRSVGDVMPAIADLKQNLLDNKLAGPRLFIAGPIFTAKGGHPTHKKGIPEAVIDRMVIQSDDPMFIKQKIAELVEQGVDGIKVVYQEKTDIQGKIIMPKISHTSLQTITDEAKKYGLWVALHSGSETETQEAIKAGITTIEHGVRHGNLISNELMQNIIANKLVYVPTLGREPKGYLNIPALIQSGVTLGVGTDSPVELPDGNSFHNELLRLVNAGMTDVSALLAATRNGAQALGKSNEMGTIEVGKFADLLLIDGEPWHDIKTLKNIEMVILNGRIASDLR